MNKLDKGPMEFQHNLLMKLGFDGLSDPQLQLLVLSLHFSVVE
jgi:hypothetical protein